MKKTLWFTKLISTLTDTAIISIILATLTGLGGRGLPVEPPVWLWSAISLIVCVVNELLARRSMGVSRFAIINFLIFFAYLAVIIYTSGFSQAGAGGKILLITAVVSSQGRILLQTFSQQKTITKIIQFDVYAVFLAWYMLCMGLDMCPEYIAGYALLVMLLNIVSTALLKARGTDNSAVESGGAGGGIAVYVVSVIIILGGSLGITAVFSKTGAVTLATIKNGLIAFLKTIGAAINKFLKWLASMINTDVDVTLPPPQEAPVLPEQSYIPEEIYVDPLIIKCIIAAVILVVVTLIVILLVKNRGKKMKLDIDVSAASPAVSRRHIDRGFSRWFDTVKAKIRFEINYLKNKDTPAGLFIWLERRGRKLGKGRKKGETMAEYIARMDVGGALSQLGAELSVIYYGAGTAAVSRADCRIMKRRYLKSFRSSRRRKK